MRTAIAIGILLGLVGCGEVTGTREPNNTGNDVPSGPAMAAVGTGNDCTRPTGAGVDATVTPGTGGSHGQGAVDVAGDGLDPDAPPCFDYSTQSLTPPGVVLTSTAFTIKDGVVQAPGNGIRIVTQWFEWYEPSAGTCQAGVNAVVEVSYDAMPVCAMEIRFGGEVDAPIYTYSTGP